ncbi:hypothetical protein SAMN02746066_03301 [Anaerosporobacter mobilis DSM 15930]|uniref:Methyl-accepting chemotaxis protein n=1 Tax=Anaerosporobacter mobilis DSM 15930 TaxID=1120996 RepID=A0A1M7LLX4_9FIRM|nr:methyl-accepting chemotaxis protein [Anaerosporobacter mobilis]SHM79191.1 hypothetical protein SAMN02746066_03301 [Anaerosporobacter mobilis DSM 15930]
MIILHHTFWDCFFSSNLYSNGNFFYHRRYTTAFPLLCFGSFTEKLYLNALNLITQEKESTVKIQRINDDINQRTTLSVEVMGITNQYVKDQVQLVNQTQSLFNEIMEAIYVLSEQIS